MRYTRYLMLIMVVAIFTACHKDPPKTYDEQDITSSYYNTEFNFGSYNTFILPDSTVLKENYLSDDQVHNFYKEGGSSDQALSLISQMFLDFGYTEVDNLSEADFIALPTLMMMESEQTVWYSPGWWWYYPGYGWYKSSTGLKGTNSYYYYPGYPWYPTGVPVTITSQTGTIAYEMIDAESYRVYLEYIENNPGAEDGPILKVNWTGMIEGATTDDAQYNKDRAQRGTEEVIAQSPYLQK